MKNTGNDADLEKAFLAEIIALTHELPRIQLMIEPKDAWVLLSFLQLTLRHPQAAQMSSAADARRMALALQSIIAKPGTVMELIANRGWAGE